MTHSPLQVSPATKRFNALVFQFDMLSFWQHDCYTPAQIYEWLRGTGQTSLRREFKRVANELGYDVRDIAAATRTETVKETQLFGI